MTTEISQVFGKARYIRRPPLALYASTLNDRSMLDQFVGNIAFVDLAVIADRGSTDGTCDFLKAHGAIVLDAKGLNSAQARALALAEISPDHVCIALEIADVLCGNLRHSIIENWRPGASVGLHLASWFFGGASDAWIDITLGRVHAHSAAPLWDNGLGKLPSQIVTLNHVSIHHRPHPRALDTGGLDGKSSNSTQEGIALLLHGRFESAASAFKRALQSSGVSELSLNTWRLLAVAQRLQNKFFEAKMTLKAAVAAYPTSRDAATDLAALLYDDGEWEHCFATACTASELPWLAPSLPGALRTTENKPLDLGAIAAHNTGRASEAVRLGSAALVREPSNERLRSNVGFYREAILRIGEQPTAITERPRLLLVSGPWSGGTSAVAGVLELLGARGLGPYLTTPDERTPCSFESLAFSRAIDAGTKRNEDTVWRSDVALAESLLAELREDISWGAFNTEGDQRPAPYFAKSPASALLIDEIGAVFDVGVIRVRRPAELIEQTRKRRGWSALYGAAGALIINAALDTPLARKVTVMDIEYDQLLKETTNIISDMGALVGGISSEQISAAIAFIHSRTK